MDGYGTRKLGGLAVPRSRDLENVAVAASWVGSPGENEMRRLGREVNCLDKSVRTSFESFPSVSGSGTTRHTRRREWKTLGERARWLVDTKVD